MVVDAVVLSVEPGEGRVRYTEQSGTIEHDDLVPRVGRMSWFYRFAIGNGSRALCIMFQESQALMAIP